ncbi:MAG: hypothetical protein LBI61_03095 [Puniceicoccales bacterium]|nr:hypothetical protein [Puniceicoccales bacterium]
MNVQNNGGQTVGVPGRPIASVPRGNGNTSQVHPVMDPRGSAFNSSPLSGREIAKISKSEMEREVRAAINFFLKKNGSFEESGLDHGVVWRHNRELFFLGFVDISGVSNTLSSDSSSPHEIFAADQKENKEFNYYFYDTESRSWGVLLTVTIFGDIKVRVLARHAQGKRFMEVSYYDGKIFTPKNAPVFNLRPCLSRLIAAAPSLSLARESFGGNLDVADETNVELINECILSRGQFRDHMWIPHAGAAQLSQADLEILTAKHFNGMAFLEKLVAEKRTTFSCSIPGNIWAVTARVKNSTGNDVQMMVYHSMSEDVAWIVSFDDALCEKDAYSIKPDYLEASLTSFERKKGKEVEKLPMRGGPTPLAVYTELIPTLNGPQVPAFSQIPLVPQGPFGSLIPADQYRGNPSRVLLSYGEFSYNTYISSNVRTWMPYQSVAFSMNAPSQNMDPCVVGQNGVATIPQSVRTLLVNQPNWSTNWHTYYKRQISNLFGWAVYFYTEKLLVRCVWQRGIIVEFYDFTKSVAGDMFFMTWSPMSFFDKNYAPKPTTNFNDTGVVQLGMVDDPAVTGERTRIDTNTLVEIADEEDENDGAVETAGEIVQGLSSASSVESLVGEMDVLRLGKFPAEGK